MTVTAGIVGTMSMTGKTTCIVWTVHGKSNPKVVIEISGLGILGQLAVTLGQNMCFWDTIYSIVWN